MLEGGKSIDVNIAAGRGLWLQAVSGQLQVGDDVLTNGDGIGIADETQVTISAVNDAEFLLFDLA
jgi:redox-sensitive bicupin YhaK (pirin superfamily)